MRRPHLLPVLSGDSPFDLRRGRPHAERAHLYWLPQPLISAHRGNLRQSRTIDLAPTARLVLREEQVLGRVNEPPGRLPTRLTVRHDGHTILDQQTKYGPDAPGWDGSSAAALPRGRLC